ncbi:hypothetical protein TNCT_607911 [Trichonephila clavata]|uniref:Uncharacterized protein n=1 Tax=Trichonephila clavata TaxID=2740835 RepID=A0A8X6FZM0_TRICU|nr:hypothetical protein TNCT_607911 [Trichonephila clavata]
MIVHRLFRLQQNWGNASHFGREERLYFFRSSNGPQMSHLLRHTDAPTSVTTCARVERRFPWSNFKSLMFCLLHSQREKIFKWLLIFDSLVLSSPGI